MTARSVVIRGVAAGGEIAIGRAHVIRDEAPAAPAAGGPPAAGAGVVPASVAGGLPAAATGGMRASTAGVTLAAAPGAASASLLGTASVSARNEQMRASSALAQVGAELDHAAEVLCRLGRPEDARVVEAQRLIAYDPTLAEEVVRLAATGSAAAALLEATRRRAAQLAGLDDTMLASRAADVRAIGRRAADLLEGRAWLDGVPGGTILVARDLGPADVADVGEAAGRVRGIALAEGAVVSHAAIMARALGVPMVVALGPELMELPDGEELYLDGGAGTLVIRPGAGVRRRALTRVGRQGQQREHADAAQPAETADGRPVTLRCNASSAAEVAAGVVAGAAGIGLIRTELPFMDAGEWPGELECALALEPLLSRLGRQTATVRVFDFGADKTPPFLAGTRLRGIELLLEREAHLRTQLTAILRVGADARLRILAPLVQTAEQLVALRTLLERCCTQVGWSGPPPPVGAMVETPAAAECVAELAAAADFLSIGTNDLSHYTLGLDRGTPAPVRAAADPLVLNQIARIAATAASLSIPVGICGEAAGEAPLAAIFLGLGVEEFSVAPVRIAELRAAIRSFDRATAAEQARQALLARDADDAYAIVAGPLQ